MALLRPAARLARRFILQGDKVMANNKKVKRLPDRTVYPSTRPLRAVRAIKSDTDEVTTTYEYDTAAPVLDEYQKFSRKLKRRTLKQLLTQHRRLVSERQKFGRLLLVTTISARVEFIKIHIDVVEKLQAAVADEIYRRKPEVAKAIRQGTTT